MGVAPESVETETGGFYTKLILSRSWRTLIARAVAHETKAAPQPKSPEDMEEVEIFWDNMTDRQYASNWPENTRHTWMGPRVGAHRYLASSPKLYREIVSKWPSDEKPVSVFAND